MMLIISLAKLSKRSKGNCGGERILICGFYSCAQILQNMEKLNPKMHMQFYFQLKSFDWCEYKFLMRLISKYRNYGQGVKLTYKACVGYNF